MSASLSYSTIESNSQAVKGESILGKQLPRASRVGVPKLSGEQKTTKGLNAARVNLVRVGRRARKQRLLKLARVVQLALTWV
jgi:hypothetical protein